MDDKKVKQESKVEGKKSVSVGKSGVTGTGEGIENVKNIQSVTSEGGSVGSGSGDVGSGSIGSSTGGSGVGGGGGVNVGPTGYSHKFDFKNLNKDPTINLFGRLFNRDTHKLLGSSGIKVSRVCLGTMNFGKVDPKFGNRPGQLDEDAAHKILDRFVELGGNCIDTANFFPWFGANSGDSERIIGNWLNNRNDRENLVIITKIRLPTNPNNVNAVGLSRNHVIQSVECCLKRLQTGYIDILQIDGWDYATDCKETVRVCDELLMSGQVRNMGVCDFKGWQLQRMIDTSKSLNKHKFACFQGEYNLLSRGSEIEVVDVCLNHNLGFIAYSPFKYGFLTDSYDVESTELEKGTRLEASSGQITNLSAMADFDITKANPCFSQLYPTIKTIADHYKCSMAQIALRWVLQKEFVSTVVVGVSNISELEESMSVLAGNELTEEEMCRLDRASQTYLPYPYLCLPTDIRRKLYMHQPGPIVYSQLAYLTQELTLNDRMFDFGYDQKHFDQAHIHYGMKHGKQRSKHYVGGSSKQQQQQQQQEQQKDVKPTSVTEPIVSTDQAVKEKKQSDSQQQQQQTTEVRTTG